MNSHDIWQIFAQDRTYEASYEELVQWIKEGAVLPEDKVKRGNLRWLDAGKIPELTNYFQNQVFDNDSMSYSAPTVAANTQVFTHFQVGETDAQSELKQYAHGAAVSSVPSAENAELKICSIHAERECFYACEICGSYFCKDCPNTFGSSVKICVSCGGMCITYEDFEAQGKKLVGAINKPYRRVEASAKPLEKISAAQDTTLRMSDFIEALKHPFEYTSSFVGFAGLFAIFATVQIILAFGGSVLLSLAAAVSIPLLILMFSVLSKTMENFRQGNSRAGFAPPLNRFTLWEDWINPVLLGFGTYLACFGLFALISIGAGVYAWFYSNASAVAPIETISARTGENSVNFNNAKTLNAGNAAYESLTHLQNQISNLTGGLYSTELPKIEKLFFSFMHLSIYFQMPICFAFIFGLILFPAICANAAESRSFAKTLNVLRGFSTMKKFGFDYLKILFMNIVFTVIVAGFFAGFYRIFAEYELHLWGVLCGIFVGSVLSFYFWLIFSRILGTAFSQIMIAENAEL